MFLADLSLFFGRFHPVLVHLPIGFLLLAALLEWWPNPKVRPAATLAWGFGALSAIVAAAMGWVLVASEGYGGDSLNWHKWLGVGVAAFSLIAFVLARKKRPINKVMGLATVVLLLITGHLGGNLTHGETYLLDHAPQIVQRIAGIDQDGNGYNWETVNPDSIQIYGELIAPILEQKCVRCHNADKQNGGLRMDAAHHLFAGGKSGPLFVTNQPESSEWIRRLTLPPDHPKFMPTSGEAVSYTELQLIGHWIENGADTLSFLRAEQTPERLKQLLRRDYGLDVSPKSFVEKLRLFPLLANEVARLNSQGWQLNPLGPNGALEVSIPRGQQIEAAALPQLIKTAGQQVVYLELENQELPASAYSLLSQLPNLNRLKLNGSSVSDTDLQSLTNLQHLEALNLYNTSVSDDGLATVLQLPQLKRLYLYQTLVSSDGLAVAAAQHPGLEINAAQQFVAQEKLTQDD